MTTKTTDFFKALSSAAAGGIVADNSPVGTVSNQISWANAKWLACNGNTIDGTTYPALYDILVAAGLASAANTINFSAGGTLVSGTPTLVGAANSVAFSPDGTKLAIAHNTNPGLTVLNTANWSAVTTGIVLNANMTSVAFSPDGTRLTIAYPGAGADNVFVVNTSNWALVTNSIGITNSPGAIAYSPDGTMLAIRTQTAISVYYTANYSLRFTAATSTNPTYGAVAFSPDGATIASNIESGSGFAVHTVSTGARVVNLPGVPGLVTDLRYSPDGTLLAVAYTKAPYLTVFNTGSWTAVQTLTAPVGIGRGVAFSPNGQILAVTHDNALTVDAPRVTLYNTNNWTVVGSIPQFTGNGRGVAFSPSGNYLAVGRALTPFLSIISPNTVSAGSVRLPTHGTGQRLVLETPVKIKALP